MVFLYFVAVLTAFLWAAYTAVVLLAMLPGPPGHYPPTDRMALAALWTLVSLIPASIIGAVVLTAWLVS
jgi:hypothetical protein